LKRKLSPKDRSGKDLRDLSAEVIRILSLMQGAYISVPQLRRVIDTFSAKTS
jgi:hypothetical protein